MVAFHLLTSYTESCRLLLPLPDGSRHIRFCELGACTVTLVVSCLHNYLWLCSISPFAEIDITRIPAVLRWWHSAIKGLQFALMCSLSFYQVEVNPCQGDGEIMTCPRTLSRC
ncbi:hypothetical protein BKA82DRAFT_532062 [Pisolithus tinctorius]|uniref:Uncharacterized protein n=1 Tax=Pisolithus tinctorius Marx 270 TaxID=870435 RepID=A0A0C3J7J1_PISTI|nr:hypothetical protein BKA82DRAFT_532062 [Pisolithus tinctorius]KIO05018.1 hypothetical protein M404DRAFT_532062 [Pisolithus tinctorius Marx 270]